MLLLKNRLRLRLLLAAIILISVCRQNIFAQNENTSSYDLTAFIEMMQTMVITASKEAEKITDAPAIIDVITEKQIKDFNVINLSELISYLPGVEMVESYYGKTMLNFRGVKETHYNNKVLMMINSNPIYEPLNGSFSLDMLPINSISRIEIIRGPGSSLYGTNAYAGVINIITKQEVNKNFYSAGAGYGSNNTLLGELQANYCFGAETGLYIAGSILNTNGYPFNVKADEKGVSRELDYFKKPTNVFLQFVTKNLQVNAGYWYTNESLYGVTPNLNYTGNSVYKDLYANASYLYKINQDIDSKIMVRYSFYDNPESNIGKFPYPGFGGHEESNVYQTTEGNILSSELQLNYKLSESISNISGIQFESFNIDPYLFLWKDDGTRHPLTPFLAGHNSNNFSAYSQFNYKYSENINLIAGMRLVKDKDIKDIFFAPRGGLVIKLSDKYTLKALYGQAFRSPSFFEKFVNTYNVLVGSPDLVSESIQTVDLSWDADINAKLTLRLNGFYNKTNDGISRISTNNPTIDGPAAAIYRNICESEIYGLEFMIKGLIGNEGYYGLTASWKSGDDILNGIRTDIRGIANFTASGWLNYCIDDLHLTPNFRYVGKREGNSTRLVSGNPVGAYNLAAYFLLNFSISYKMELFTISVTGSNLLNTKYSFPEYIRGMSEEVPGGPGRTIYASVSLDIF